MNTLFVAAGGAVGAVLRYVVSGWSQRMFPATFPWGTLIVNLSGSLVIGLLWGTFESVVVSPNIRLFVLIGLLGSFTTFSTFSLESLNLVRDGEYALLCWNVSLSVILGIGLAFTGYVSARSIIGVLR